MLREQLRLYAITDRKWLKEGETLADRVEEAIRGGATIVQLREKQLKADDLKKLAISIKKICNKYNVPLIINDDPYLARDIDADGVHVGQSDVAIEEARKILGKDKLVGATAKTVEQAKKACEAGADYLGSGAVFGSTTKLNAIPMTKELLVEICNSVSIPVVAIGGIDITNVDKLAGAPIAGVAVVSGIFASDSVCSATSALSDKLRDMGIY